MAQIHPCKNDEAEVGNRASASNQKGEIAEIM